MTMRPIALALAFIIISTPVFAQADRIDQLEQDIIVLQRKLDRVSTGSTAAAPRTADSGVGIAQADSRITALEEEIRGLRGMVEQKEFESRRISEEFDKFKRDAELRMAELEKNVAANAAAPAPAPAPAAAAPAKPGKTRAELSVKEEPVAAEAPPAPPKAEETAAAEEPVGDTPREQYNYAFRLLNQNQYEEASKRFAEFTKKYPKDPLVGNAYYWRGETFYIQKDFSAAAENFQQGYESMQKGPKAPDNLLKLGMSLAALKKKDEACVVLAQVVSKYKTSAANVAAKAQTEQKRAGC